MSEINPRFYCVIGNRDHLKVKKSEIIKEPVWKFIDGQEYWLTSLVYAKGVNPPPGQRFFDCGAWSYKNAQYPKWTPEECMNQYLDYATTGDLVTSPDHMVLRNHDAVEEKRRIELTLENARKFLRLCPLNLIPVGVTHGDSYETRISMTKELLSMGYRYLAIGGVAGIAGSKRKVKSILEETVNLRDQCNFKIHVLGVSAPSWVPVYRDLGIDSYDGSAMFYAAFTGACYYWIEDGKIIKYSVKDLSPEQIPLCSCPACKVMREQGDDTRTMGSNERNMGRAVHNINMYLKALKIEGN